MMMTMMMTIMKMLSRKTMELFVSIIALDQKSTWMWVKMILMEMMMMVKKVSVVVKMVVMVRW